MTPGLLDSAGCLDAHAPLGGVRQREGITICFPVCGDIYLGCHGRYFTSSEGSLRCAGSGSCEANAQREFNAVFDNLHLSVWYLSVLYTGSGGPGRTVYNCLHLDVSFWPNILVSYCYIRILLFFLNGTRLAPDRVPRPRLGKSTYGENTNEYHASQDVCEVPGPDGPRRRPGSG
jgi:hypothetical protein